MGRDERSRPAPAIDTLRFVRRTRWVANFRGMCVAPAQSFQSSTSAGSIVRVSPARAQLSPRAARSPRFEFERVVHARAIVSVDRAPTRAHRPVAAPWFSEPRTTVTATMTRCSTRSTRKTAADCRGEKPRNRVQGVAELRGAKKRTRAKWPAHLAISSLVSWTPTQRPSS